MKTTYIIAIAVIVLVVIVGTIFAYPYISGSNSTSPTPSPAPTATPTPTPTASTHPTASPTAIPTAAPTPSPTPSPAPVPTPTPTPAPLASATITAGGGTLVYPLMQTWIGQYATYQSQITINYNPVGSGTGISNFQQKLYQIGETDAPMTAAQYQGLPTGTTAITVPISASGVVPAYNLKLLNGTVCQNGLNFSGAVLGDIFIGKITYWDDPAIVGLQSATVQAQLPHTAIICVHRSDGSGTMFAFTDFLYKTSSDWATQVGGPSTSPNIWPSLPNELEGNKNAGVAQNVAANNGAIGPLEISYILDNPGQTNLAYGAVQNGTGNYILANITNMAAALQAGANAGLPAGNAQWTTVSIIDNIYNDQTDTTIYPIVTMTYALVYQQQSDQATGAAVVNFLSWIINSGQNAGIGIGYVPLPTNIIANCNASLKLITSPNGTPYIS
ncbi:MAG: phosphate ABC transporter substrate-binding protein PstS [Candidatus Bathyarchaeia archaeon]|jgi:phosphate transport system substrate-binding protein